ncbi:Inosine triphosphate pyrophosphatase [Cladobotryum mycophilum]|uniref:Inosine triphosphate pyrophosphatase n=1 Tax=Cladobotryum mycophilum TaxID=491253 RepID=A0ABR0SLW6_9HYPO
MTPRVFFITGNSNKLREVKSILEPRIEVQSQSLDLEEIQGTIEEVTESKCRRAAELGKIVPARGPSNFGWDPVFEFEGKTFAEMKPEEKNKISHRARALKKLDEWFGNQVMAA